MAKATSELVGKLNGIASNAKSLNAFVSSTIAKYNTVAVELHQTACMALFHTAQFREPYSLNLFYKGLHTNDQTALRVWIGKHAKSKHANGELKSWISFTKFDNEGKGGFKLIKGSPSADLYTVDVEQKGKLMLIGVDPFYIADVRTETAYTYEMFLKSFVAFTKREEAKAEKEKFNIPASLKAGMSTVAKAAEAELEKLTKAPAKMATAKEDGNSNVAPKATRGRKPKAEQPTVN